MNSKILQRFSATGNPQLDEKCKTYLTHPNSDTAFDILICCRCSNHVDDCILFGEYFLTLYPYNNLNLINNFVVYVTN